MVLAVPLHTCSQTVLCCADLKGKELVMRLMMNSDPEVQKQALLCVQKIMLAKDKAQFLAGESEA